MMPYLHCPLNLLCAVCCTGCAETEINLCMSWMSQALDMRPDIYCTIYIYIHCIYIYILYNYIYMVPPIEGLRIYIYIYIYVSI